MNAPFRGLRLFFVLVAALAAATAVAAPFAYITMSDGNVAVIDAQSLRLGNHILLGGDPSGVAVNPGGINAYVSNPSSNLVSVIYTPAQSPVAHIQTAPGPSGVILNSSGTRAYVLHPTSGPTPLTVISTESRSVIGSVTVGAGAARLAIDPGGAWVYSANRTGNSISVVQTSTNTVYTTIPVGDGPLGLAFDARANRLYVGQYGNATPGNTVTVIDAGNNTVVTTIPVGQRPGNLALSPDGRLLFVANEASNTVYAINTATLALTTIMSAPQPIGIDVSPDGAYLFIVNAGNSTVVMRPLFDLTAVHSIVSLAATPTSFGRFIGGEASASANLPGPLTGLWWNPTESGWGIHLTQRNNIVFAAWFTYDPIGSPRWYVASSCTMSAPLPCPSCIENSRCDGKLYEATAQRFFREPNFNPASVNLTEVGVLQVQFRDRREATMSYVVGNQTRTLPIQRQSFRTATAVPTDFTDLWWNPGESGWGLGITHQADVMFLTWFIYEDTGRATWLVASNCAVNAAGNGCTGTLYRTSGPPGPSVTPSFDSSRLTVTPVGTITVSFSDANNATISYTVDNFTASKTITRQLF